MAADQASETLLEAALRSTLQHDILREQPQLGPVIFVATLRAEHVDRSAAPALMSTVLETPPKVPAVGGTENMPPV